jgi:hypothetical protein
MNVMLTSAFPHTPFAAFRLPTLTPLSRRPMSQRRLNEPGPRLIEVGPIRSSVSLKLAPPAALLLHEVGGDRGRDHPNMAMPAIISTTATARPGDDIGNRSP